MVFILIFNFLKPGPTDQNSLLFYTTIKEANQHERKFIEKFYDKPQYGRDQKGRQLESIKKSLGFCHSDFNGRSFGFHGGVTHFYWVLREIVAGIA
jgi:hypothetical protein